MKCDETEKAMFLQAYRAEIKEKKGMMSSLFGTKK